MCSVIGYQQAFALKFSERSRGFYRANRDRLHLNEGTEAANDAIVLSLDILVRRSGMDIGLFQGVFNVRVPLL
jgi:hypothetical protein